MAAEFDQLKGDFTKLVEELRDSVVKRDAETRAIAQEAKDQNVSASKETLDKIEGIEKRMKDIGEQLSEMETERLERQRNHGGDARSAFKDPGQQFIDSDVFKEFRSSGTNTCRNVEVTGLMEQARRSRMGFETRASLSADSLSDNAGALINPMRYGGIFQEPLKHRTRLRDILRSQTTTEKMVEYVKETGFHNISTGVTAVEPIAETVIAVTNAQGFYPGQTVFITTGATTDTRIIASGGVDLSANTITLTEGISVATVVATTEVWSNTFVFVPQLELKPSASVEYELIQAAVKTLPHTMPIARQALDDLNGLRQTINGRLLEGLEVSVERQLLYGDASATNQIAGLLTDSDVLTYSWSSGFAGDTMLDAIRRAITAASLANYPPDFVVLHERDWETIELQKGSDGHYVWAVVMTALGPMVWSMRVVVTNAINKGTFLVGSARFGSTLWERETANIRFAEEHSDFFARNMVMLLAETRLCQTIERPSSFVVGTFDGAPGTV